MATARIVLDKLRSSDGRIRIKTLSGVSALVAVIALLVGVLPAIATHVEGSLVQYGGGPGACAFVGSDAEFELHINNPTVATSATYTGIDGTRVKIDIDGTGKRFTFTFVDANNQPIASGASGTNAAYDVVVNGGSHNLHYDYDGQGDPAVTDSGLHAPLKNNGDLSNLSHINICYDVQPVTFICGAAPIRLESEGLFTIAEAQIFANSVVTTCNDKQAFFFIDNTDTEEADPSVTLAFTGDTGQDVAGRLDVTKEFGDPELFVDLEYDGPGTFVPVQWCNVGDKATGDGNEFDDVLGPDLYPTLDGVVDGADPAISCKVAEEENAAGIQYTVVYFELEDPQWR